MAASPSGERGSVEESMTSLMPKVVPSTSLTVTIVDRGPLNSTTCTDRALSLRTDSNSGVETMGMAWTGSDPAVRRRSRDDEDATKARLSWKTAKSAGSCVECFNT